MAILSDQDFLLFSGYTTCSNMDYLRELLASLESIITDKVGTLFSISSVTDYAVFGAGLDLVKGIGAWQSITSIVRKSAGFSASFPLIEYTHYILKRYSEQPTVTNNPITAIKLLNLSNNQFSGLNSYLPNQKYYLGVGGGESSNKLGNEEYLLISGNYGWGTTAPADLKNLLYSIAKAKLEYNTQMTKSQGGGVVTSERTLSRSRSLAISPEALKSRDALAKNIMADPEVASLITKYKNYTTKTMRIS